MTPIQTKRADLLAERAALLGRLDVLQGKLDLLDEIEPQVPALPLAVETVPAVAATHRRGVRGAHGESSQPLPAGHSSTTRRLMIARLVAGRGSPARAADIARELGLTPQNVWYSLTTGGWFEKSGDGYTLTEAGRRAMAESSRGPGE